MSSLFDCPSCGHKHDTTDWTENFNNDGDIFEIECHQCEEDFSVVPTIEVIYEHPCSL